MRGPTLFGEGAARTDGTNGLKTGATPTGVPTNGATALVAGAVRAQAPVTGRVSGVAANKAFYSSPQAPPEAPRERSERIFLRYLKWF